MLPPHIAYQPQTTDRLPRPDVLSRICVRPPYFALRDPELAGTRFSATALAEAPTYLELGPIAAADLGRHAAITGLAHAALTQRDDARRYYLAQQADCVYTENAHPYGTPVRLTSELLDFAKRSCRVRVAAEAGGAPLATIEVGYTILPEGAFERLFRIRAKATPPAPSPYGRLLMLEFERGEDWAEQIVAPLPVGACVGHFDGHPALPVAVLMGQLSYLAGCIASDGRIPYRVVRGLIEASDLAWAGERALFRVERRANEGRLQRFACTVRAEDREVGSMELWLELVGEGDPIA